MARRKRATFLSKQAPLSIRQHARRILIWLGVVSAVLAVACVGAYFFLMSWLQGAGFRQYLAGFLGQLSGAQVVSVPENLVLDGNHMTLPSSTLEEAPLFRRLSLNKLHLEVDRSALLNRMLKLRHLSVEELQLTLGPEPEREGASAPAAQKATAPHVSGKGFFKTIQAPAFESHYTDTKFIMDEKSARHFRLSGFHLLAKPSVKNGEHAWNVRLENGRILTPFSWLKEGGLKSATILSGGDEVKLSESHVLLSPGELQMQGVFHTRTGLWKAQADIRQADVARLLNADWSKKLTGRLWGKLSMSGEYPTAWEAQGQLRLKDGMLEGLPILSDIKLHGTRPYRSLSLESASCTLTYPYAEPELGIRDAWLWDSIDVRAAGGALLIRGRVITGTDGSLSGSLSIGLPVSLLAELGLSNTPLVDQLFNGASAESSGYVWVHVNLSGTVDAPQEDLSVRLATVLPQALPGMAEQAVKSLNAVIGNFLPPGQAPAPQEEEAAEQDKKPQPTRIPGQEQLRNAIESGLDMFL